MANPTMTLIASNTVGAGGVSSVTFSSIPSTYTDLVIKYSVRDTTAQVYGDLAVRFNGDSGANYPWKFLRGNGSAASSQAGSANTYAYTGSGTGNSSTANTFANGELYIPNYTSSNYKSVSTDNVGENNATLDYTELGASIWNSTAAISSITFYLNSAVSIMQYSTFYLYGIKNS